MFRSIFVGGTFDGLHKGHIALLSKAFAYGTKVTVGLTSHAFVQKFKVQSSKFKVKQFIERKQALKQWLHKEKYTSQVKIISIDDPYEPVASGDFDALVVTKDNRKTGEEINRRRRKKGLRELALINVPLIQAEDKSPISSTRVRNGEIDHKGRLIMPQSLIPALRMPLGEIIGEEEIRYKITDLRNNTIITVGDMTTKRLLDLGIVPDLSIIDGKVGRKPFHDAINMLQPEKASPRPVGGQAFQAIAVKSGPGFLAIRAIRAVKATLEKIATQGTQATQVGQGTRATRAMLAMQGTRAMQVGHGTRARHATQARQEKQVIVVEGEEDLLALPAILYAPIGSVVLYGQPNEGIVQVFVTSLIKKRVRTLIAQFIS